MNVIAPSFVIFKNLLFQLVDSLKVKLHPKQKALNYSANLTEAEGINTLKANQRKVTEPTTSYSSDLLILTSMLASINIKCSL